MVVAAAGESVAVDGAISVELCRLREPGHGAAIEPWKPCDSSSWKAAERGPATSGTMRQAVQGPFAIVHGAHMPHIGTGHIGRGSEGEMLAVYLANLFLTTSDATPAVLPDAAVDLAFDASGALSSQGISQPVGHLLLIGGPAANAASAKIAQYWRHVGHAVTWSPHGVISIGGCAMPSAGVGALVLGPTPGGGLALIIDGDAEGLRDAIAAGEPTIPPMARAPFSNLLPDYLVTGPAFKARGYGGVLAAGFFDHSWSVSSVSSYRAIDCYRSSLEP